jgi:hypothetical protein
VRVSELQPMIYFKIPLQLSRQRVELTYREKFSHLFPAIHRDEWVLSSPEMVFWITVLHLFHTYQLVHFHHYLICGRGCPFSIKSSSSLLLFLLFWFSSRVFIFALTCLVLIVDGFPSLFIYIYRYRVFLVLGPLHADESSRWGWMIRPGFRA